MLTKLQPDVHCEIVLLVEVHNRDNDCFVAQHGDFLTTEITAGFDLK